jgi:[acyl-carrier-protein] S-malonyltransferase
MAKRTLDGVTTLSLGVPDDLDKLLSTLSEPRSSDWAHEPGEHLFVTERLVVSPGAGVFRCEPGIGAGSPVDAGTLVGHVGDLEVRSAFAGELVDVLAVDGERLAPSEPVAWLRSA